MGTTAVKGTDTGHGTWPGPLNLVKLMNTLFYNMDMPATDGLTSIAVFMTHNSKRLSRSEVRVQHHGEQHHFEINRTDVRSWVNFSTNTYTQDASDYQKRQNLFSWSKKTRHTTHSLKICNGRSQHWAFPLFWAGNLPYPKQADVRR